MRNRRAEAGSASLLAVGCTVGLGGLLLVLLAFYQVWLVHMRSELVADAAAQGALEALRPRLADELRRRGEANLEALLAELSAAAEAYVATWELNYRADRAPAAGDYPTDAAYQQAVQAFEQDLARQREQVRRQAQEAEVWKRKGEIAPVLIRYLRAREEHQPAEPLPLVSLVRHFLTAEERGCAVWAAAGEHRDELTAAATRLAEDNGAGLAAPPNLEEEGGTPGLQAAVRVPLRLLVANRYLGEGQRYLEGRARVFIRGVLGEPVTVPAHCA